MDLDVNKADKVDQMPFVEKFAVNYNTWVNKQEPNNVPQIVFKKKYFVRPLSVHTNKDK